MLEAQDSFHQHTHTFFKELFAQNTSNALWEFLVVVVGVTAGCLLCLLFALSVVSAVDRTLLLFGFMTRAEVEKEMENCNSFLDIFYQDSYLIKLKKATLDQEINTTPAMKSMGSSDYSSFGPMSSRSIHPSGPVTPAQGSSRMELN